jgi:hypothetical protein
MSQPWLASMGEREHAAFVARRHIEAETTTDVDAICATVARDVFFALPVRTRAGHELVDGAVLTSHADVRGYYSSRSGSYVVRASNQVKSVVSDWYSFNESSATLLGTGLVGDVDATAREFVVNSAVLFPAAPEGIRGEICATRHPFDDVVRGTVVASESNELDNAALLDAFVGALRARSWSSLDLAESHTLAVRVDDDVHVARDAGASRDALASIFGDAEDVTLLVRVAAPWYLFAEYLVLLANGRGRRIAMIHPVEAGRLTGSFGLGRTGT